MYRQYEITDVDVALVDCTSRTDGIQGGIRYEVKCESSEKMPFEMPASLWERGLREGLTSEAVSHILSSFYVERVGAA